MFKYLNVQVNTLFIKMRRHSNAHRFQSYSNERSLELSGRLSPPPLANSHKRRTELGEAGTDRNHSVLQP